VKKEEDIPFNRARISKLAGTSNNLTGLSRNKIIEEIALEALDKIAEHEKECGIRWAEAAVELRELRSATKNHAARWEKLAWLIVATMLTCITTILTYHL
tara:strand:+ start:1083 stop:1382 length:300 start_codon:yes stop_codon:yes gene_type:complete